MTLSRSTSSSDTRPDSRRSFSSCSISISTTDSSCSSDSDESSINRPVLHHRRRERESSSKKTTRNGNIPMYDNSKTLKHSSSSRRLKTFKKKLASTLKKKSYEAIDSSGRTFGQSSISSSIGTNGGESRRPPSRSNSDKRRRPGVRRTVSYEDEFHSLYKAAAEVRERQGSDENLPGRTAVRRHSSTASDNSLCTRETGSSNPSFAEDLLRHPYSGNSTYARNETFGAMPNSMSTPNLMNRQALPSGRKAPTPSTSSSSRASSRASSMASKASSKSTNELLSRAGAVAGRKQWKQSNQEFPPPLNSLPRSQTTSALPFPSHSSKPMIRASTVSDKTPRLDAPQPASSSSPHLLATSGSPATQKERRRQSDTAIDLAFFRKHLEAIESSLNNKPTILEGMGRQEQSLASNRDGSSKSDYNGVSNNRRRSKTKRQYHNEIVMEPKQTHATNNTDKHRTQKTKDQVASQRRYQFRKDFPRDPIPSDAILMRLYSNIPPPPPLNKEEEQAETAAANDDVMATPLSKTLKLQQSILSPTELQQNKDAASCLTFDSLEWRVWKESVDKSRRNSKTKYVSTDDIANDASRRSESSKSKTSSASSRRSSHRELKPIDSSDRHRSRSGGNRAIKSRLVPKSKGETSNSGREIRSNDLSSSIHDSKSSKRKGKRRDGLSASAHGDRTKSKKKGDSIKVKSKNSHQSPRVMSSDLFPMSPATQSTRDLSHNSASDSHGFPLDLSNGSFGDSNHESSDHRMRTSLTLLRNSLTKMNSVRSLNSSGIPKPASQSSFNSSGGFMSSGAESFVEADDKTDREQRKKRRGKRGNSIGSESRSRSSEGRHSTKTRRGRRGSKSKLQRDDVSPDYDFDDSVSFEFESSLNDLRPSVSREGSRRDMRDDSTGKTRRSPKITKKGNETGPHRRRSPKVVSKKISRDDSTGKKGKSPRTVIRKNSKNQDSYPSPRSSPRNTSRKTSPVKTTKTEFEISNSKLVNDLEFTPLSPRFGKLSPEQAKKEEDDFYDLALSSWVDRPKETPSPSSPRAKKHTEPPRRKESLKGRNSRWLPEISPGTRSAVMEAPPVMLANVAVPSPSPKPKIDRKKIDFPLNFVEYTDVSPLTVASKKAKGIPVNNRFEAPLSYMGA